MAASLVVQSKTNSYQAVPKDEPLFRKNTVGESNRTAKSNRKSQQKYKSLTSKSEGTNKVEIRKKTSKPQSSIGIPNDSTSPWPTVFRKSVSVSALDAPSADANAVTEKKSLTPSKSTAEVHSRDGHQRNLSVSKILFRWRSPKSAPKSASTGAG